MKKLAILFTLLCMSSAFAETEMTFKGTIPQILKMEGKVIYEAQRKIPGCGHWGTGIEDLGAWIKKVKVDEFTMVRNGNHYEMDIEFEAGKSDFCHYKVKDMVLSVSPNEIKTPDLPVYMTYQLHLREKAELVHSINEVEKLKCRIITNGSNWFVCGHQFTKTSTIGAFDTSSALYVDFGSHQDQEFKLNIEMK